MKKIAVLLALAVSFATISAHAQLANFQIIGQNLQGPVVPTYTGAGVLTGNNTWDPFAANSNGSKAVGATTVTDSTTGFTFTVGYTGNYYKQDAASTNSLLQGYVYTSNGAAGTIAFSNLTPGMYNLVLYSQDSSYGAAPTSFTLAGTTRTASQGNDSTFAAGVNYVEYVGLTVGASGTLNGTFASSTGAEGDFNGAQLQLTAASAVPEPSTFVSLPIGIGALALFARRRLAA